MANNTWIFLLLALLAGTYECSTKENYHYTFITVFISNVNGEAKSNNQLYITSFLSDTNVLVTVKNPPFKQAHSMQHGQSLTVDLSSDAELKGTGKYFKAITIHSSKFISVVSSNQKKGSVDTSLVYPVSKLGQEYYAFTPSALGYPKEIAVFATQDSTLVTVELKCTVTLEDKIYKPNEKLTARISSSEVLYLESSEDCTGSRVVSDKPVGVISGHACALKNSKCQHAYEQLLPVEQWGKSFIIPPLEFQDLQDSVFVFAAQPTRFTYQFGPKTQIAILKAGQWKEFPIGQNPPLVISSDQPIQVLYYCSSGKVSDDTISDPFIMNIVPSDKFCESYTLVGMEGFSNYALIVAKTEDIKQVQFDECHPSFNWQEVHETEYSWAQYPYTKGGSHLTLKSPCAPVGVYSIGTMNQNSYGTPAPCGILICTHNGQYHPLGKPFWDEDSGCTRICKCSPSTGFVTCQKSQCKAEEECRVIEGLSKCAAKTTPAPVNPLKVLPCIHKGESHPPGKPFWEDSACTVLCECNSSTGLVSCQKSKCKPEEECKITEDAIECVAKTVPATVLPLKVLPCIHKGESHPPGKPFWEDSACTVFCLCDPSTGSVRCQKSKCKAEEECNVVEGVSACVAKIPQAPVIPLKVLPCIHKGESHSPGKPFWEDSACTVLCECNSSTGLVSCQKSKCKPEEECKITEDAIECVAKTVPATVIPLKVLPCIHKGESHPPGKPFWEDSACTVFCLCDPLTGSVRCQKSKCKAEEECNVVEGVSACVAKIPQAPVIPLKVLPCIHKGESHLPGKPFWEDSACTVLCECNSSTGLVSCQKSKCKPEEECKITEDVIECVAKTAPAPVIPLKVLPCIHKGKSHPPGKPFWEDSACLVLCVCNSPTGLVSCQKSRCKPEEECKISEGVSACVAKTVPATVIPLKVLSCIHKGESHPPGKPFWEDSACTVLCLCDPSTGSVRCQKSKCKAEEECNVVEGVSACVAKIPQAPVIPLKVLPCIHKDESHPPGKPFWEDSACTVLCECDPSTGLVSCQKSKCKPEEECKITEDVIECVAKTAPAPVIPLKVLPCIHKGKSHPPGKPFWEDSACSVLCVCNSPTGLVSCQKSRCKPEEECKITEGVSACVAKTVPAPVIPLNVLSCIHKGESHPTGKPFWEDSACTVLCLCDPSTGSVRCQKSKCKAEEECNVVEGVSACVAKIPQAPVIPLKVLPCIHKDESHPPGKPFWEDSACTVLCECDPSTGLVSCQKSKCKPEEECKITEDVIECVAKTAPAPVIPLKVLPCIHKGKSHPPGKPFWEDSACSVLCVCNSPTGLVSCQKSRCKPEEECKITEGVSACVAKTVPAPVIPLNVLSCIHKGESHPPGKPFWEDSACTVLCLCDPSTGSVRCQKSKCKAEEECNVVEGVSACVAKIPQAPVIPLKVLPCTHMGESHPPGKPFWEDSACTVLCECDPSTGLVSCQKSKCKLEEECKITEGVSECVAKTIPGPVDPLKEKYPFVYITAYMLNAKRKEKSKNELFITSYQPHTNVLINIDKSSFKKELDLEDPKSVTVQVPSDTEMQATGEYSKMAVIHSSKLITVVTSNQKKKSVDISLVYPVTEWGQEYYVFTPSARGYPKELAVFSGLHPTSVSVELKCAITFQGKPYKPHEKLTINLPPFEILYLESKQDCTGSRVVSDKPVGVISGHACAWKNSKCQHAFEQLLPVERWGTSFIVPPLKYQVLEDSVYIFAAKPTHVSYQFGAKVQDINLKAGQWKALPMGRSPPLVISSTQPIQVLYYCNGGKLGDGTVFDPFIMNIVPNDKFCSTHSLEGMEGFSNYALIVAKTTDINEVQFDELHPSFKWEQVHGTEYSWTHYTYEKGRGHHTLMNPSSLIGVYSVGTANENGYGAPAACGLLTCKHNGQYHPTGKPFWRDSACTTLCECSPSTGIVSCKKSSCKAGEECKVVGGIKKCLEKYIPAPVNPPKVDLCPVKNPKCGCDHQGKLKMIGEVWLLDDCSEQCTCLLEGSVHCEKAGCSPGESCVEQGGVHLCYVPEATCHLLPSGGFKSFDGLEDRVWMEGTYSLAMLAPSAQVAFRVIAHLNLFACEPAVIFSSLTFNDLKVEVKQDMTTMVNGKQVSLPFRTNSGVEIMESQGAVEIQHPSGLILRYCSSGKVSLTLAEAFRGQITGLCGNFNGQANDDLRLRDGSFAEDFGKFYRYWKI